MLTVIPTQTQVTDLGTAAFTGSPHPWLAQEASPDLSDLTCALGTSLEGTVLWYLAHRGCYTLRTKKKGRNSRARGAYKVILSNPYPI